MGDVAYDATVRPAPSNDRLEERYGIPQHEVIAA